MKRPAESDYKSHVAYTRALEEYCDSLEAAQLAQEPVVDKGFPWTQKHGATSQVFGAMPSNIPPALPAQKPVQEKKFYPAQYPAMHGTIYDLP